MNRTLTRTLRRGVRGNDVAQVQADLNQLSSTQPRLVTDGIYGGKTVARVLEFQRRHQLAADGIVGPKTFAALIALLKKTVGGPPGIPPGTPPGIDNTKRRAVILEAAKLVGKVDFAQKINGRPKGIDLVRDIFREAADVALTVANFIVPVTKAWSPPPIVGGQKKSWCGIFCVYCYRKAGFNAIKWSITKGGPTGPIALNSWSPQFVQNIKVADIGAVATFQHHFLIEKVEAGNPATPRLETIDGNLLAGRIERRSGYHRVGKDNFNYYSMK